MKRPLIILCLLMISITVLTGCGAAETQAPTSTATYPPPVTAEPSPPTETPLPTATPIPPTPTAYQPIEGMILFDDMRLRSGPGFLFDTIDLYAEDQTVSLLGYAPAGNWLYVRTVDGLTGWMKQEGIDLDGNLYDAPQVIPEDAIIIKGRVYAPNGSPASSIGVMVQPEDAVETEMQDVCKSDFTGRYYIYLPPESSGNWRLEANSYGCDGTNVDTTCSLIGHFPDPQMITLPTSADQSFDIKLLP